MPDHMPEHNEHPPQWPPPSWHNEPTARPQTAGVEPEPLDQSTQDDDAADDSAASSGGFADPGGAGIPPAYPVDQSYSDQPRAAEPNDFGAPPSPEPVSHPGPVSAAPAAPEPTPTPSRTPALPPPTHARAVRMTIYGIGGAIVIALLVAIIVMAGGTLVPNSGEGDGDGSGEGGAALVNADGEIDEAVYAELAGNAGTTDWVDWRYGAASESANDAGNADEPDTKKLDTGNGIDHVYQHGDGSAPQNPRNIQGQLGFVTDDGSAGVDRVTTVETTDSTVGFTPRPGGRFSADAAEVELTEGSTAKCLGDSDVGRLVAMDRADGKEFSAHAVLAFSSGAIATTGISGASGGTCVQLPNGQVPTAVAVTPANEFALVTVWDTEKVSGHVAVIALGDKAETYASSWPNPYPGLPNPGHFGFAKLLGMVDLTAKAPTSIAVGTDFAGSAANRTQADLSDTAVRAGFADDVATSGFAAVGSQAEKTVEWIDLSPLLKSFAAGYFEGDAGVYAKPGTDAEQWPPDFATAPDSAPVVTGATEVAAEPSAMAAVKNVVYVADTGGKLTSFDLSDPTAGKEAGAMDLPGAASCLTTTADGKQLLATSRSDRSVSWIKPGKDGGSVTQTLRDGRITDPICAEDSAATANSDGGSLAHTVSIADFGSQSLLTFRYGKGSLVTGGDISLKSETFEFGGAYESKGRPFAVSTTIDNS